MYCCNYREKKDFSRAVGARCGKHIYAPIRLLQEGKLRNDEQKQKGGEKETPPNPLALKTKVERNILKTIYIYIYI